MDAYKCDRCGKIYVKNSANLEYTNVERLYLARFNPVGSNWILDLCCDCNHDLDEWFSKFNKKGGRIMADNYNCGEVDCDDYKDGKCTYQGYCPNGPLHLVKTAKIVMVSPRDLIYRCGHCGAYVEGWHRYCAHCGYKLEILGGD